MCGPADFEALHVCITRLALLSAAGLATYSVRKAASPGRPALPEQREQRDSVRQEPADRLAAEGSSGRPGT